MDGVAPEHELELAKALLDRGLELEEGDRWEEALAAFDELLGRLNRDEAAAALVSEGLAERAYVLPVLQRLEEAVAACAELERRFAGVGERKLRNRVGWAIATQAAHLKDLGRPAEWLAAADRLLRLDAQEPLHPEDVAWTLRIKADAVGHLTDAEAELAVYDDLVR